MRIGWLVLRCFMGKAIHNLLTDLLGESKLDSLACGSSQCGQAFFRGFRIILHLWDSDAFLFGEVFAADSWKGNGFVDTGLDGLGVGDGYLRLNYSHNRDILARLLSDLLAVVFSISMSMTVSVLCRLANGHHLGFALLVEGDLNGFCSCDLALGLIRVAADFVINLLGALCTNCACNCVTLLCVNHSLDSKFHRCALCLESRSTNLCQLHYILHGAVVFGVLVAVARFSVSVGMCRTSCSYWDQDKEKSLKCE